MTGYSNIERLVLASGSPRRKEMLENLGLTFEVQVPEIDESPLPNEPPAGYAERLAHEKAAAVNVPHTTTILAADTVVVHEGRLLGKPGNANEAYQMLSSLSGRAHHVITGLALRRGVHERLISCSTEVFFRSITDAEIRTYIETGCPMDKAGAYAIQGGAAHMVSRINGSYTNVVGLPMCELHELLISF